jgi:hypothetical protein
VNGPTVKEFDLLPRISTQLKLNEYVLPARIPFTVADFVPEGFVVSVIINSASDVGDTLSSVAWILQDLLTVKS